VSLFHNFKRLHAQLQQEELKEYNVKSKKGGRNRTDICHRIFKNPAATRRMSALPSC
jgi:hypothetical protein